MDKKQEILQSLDPRQREAVRQVDGPVLIVAGAGSGKTRVLTSRVAYTIANGCPPERIMALTFTKKAAGEMKERIAAMVGPREARHVVMGTFHSVFIRFLRDYADFLGYPKEFTIASTGDSTSLLKRILKARGLDDKVYKPKEVLNRISSAKNNLVTPAAYRANPTAIKNDTYAKKPEICNIYGAYQDALKQSGVMDFDDILLNMNILLRDNAEALHEIAARFDYLLVDEYQDTNFSQYLILRKLSQFAGNICVVGDDSQSIYAFRGAKIENILNFQKDYPKCKVFRLEQNYRSTQTIVSAANSLIAKNENRIKKDCFSQGDVGAKINIIKSYSEDEEARLVSGAIASKLQIEHAQYQDFAILYRTNAQSRALEEALRGRNLPYIIYSGNSFYDRLEVRNMMAYLKLAVNPSDDESFLRVVNTPARGIGDTTLEALRIAAITLKCSLLEAAFREELPSFGLKPAAIGRLRAFGEMMLSFNDKVATTAADVLAGDLDRASGLSRSYLEDNSVESQGRAANVDELKNTIMTFVEAQNNEYVETQVAEGKIHDSSELRPEDYPTVPLTRFLEDVSLLSAVDVGDEDQTNNKIALMTVHAAKGLEFKYVFITGMEENLFPSGMFTTTAELEEERRLFYVALTRAEISVTLSFAVTRMRNGMHESNPPSRFIGEIDRQYIENPLRETEFETDDFRPSSYGGWGQRQPFSNYRSGGSSYMGSSKPVVTRPTQSQASSSAGRPASPRPMPSSPRPLLSKVLSPTRTSAEFLPSSVLDFKEGQRVEHNRFGQGRIVKISGRVTDLKATVNFDDFGEKILLLKYAKMRII